MHEIFSFIIYRIASLLDQEVEEVPPLARQKGQYGITTPVQARSPADMGTGWYINLLPILTSFHH